MLKARATRIIASLACMLAAFSAAAILFAPAVSQAAAPQAKTQAPGYYRMMLGDFEITAISDGTLTIPLDKLLTNTTPEVVQEVLADIIDSGKVAAEILEHLGYSAVVCCDGNESIELYRQAIAAKEPFTAVIMDLTIPGGLGGKETMKKLMEIDKGVIGIVSSGYCNDPILSSYRDYGFSGIMKKPYSLDELGKVLHDLLAGGGSLQQ